MKASDHGKCVIEIIDAAGKSFIMRWLGFHHGSLVVTAAGKGDTDVMTLDRTEVPRFLEETAPIFAHAIWESQGSKPEANSFYIRAMEINMESLVHRYSFFRGSPIELDDSYSAANKLGEAANGKCFAIV